MEATVFWSILGSILLLAICLVLITYIICRYRKPHDCDSSDPIEEILQTTMTNQEIRTVPSSDNQYLQTHRNFPKSVIIQRESVKRVTKTNSQNTKIMFVGSGDHFLHPNMSSSPSQTGLLTTNANTKDKMADVAV